MDNAKDNHNNDDAATPAHATSGTGRANKASDLRGSDEGATRYFTVDDWKSFVDGVRIMCAGDKPRILLLLSDIANTESQWITDLLSLGDILGVHELNARSPEATHAAIKRQASRDTNWSKVVAVPEWKPFELGVWDVEAFPLETGGLKVAIHTGTGHRSLASGYLNAPSSASERNYSADPKGSTTDLIATLITTKENELPAKGDSAREKSWAFAPAYSEDGKTLSYATRIREILELLRVGWTQPIYVPQEAPDCTTFFVSCYTGKEKRFWSHWDDSRKGDKLLITRIK
jgi:hypothetical protein